MISNGEALVGENHYISASEEAPCSGLSAAVTGVLCMLDVECG